MSISHDQTVIVWTIEGEKIKSINTEDSNYGGLVWDSNTLLCSAYSNIKILKWHIESTLLDIYFA
jgi:hypothetical protein